MRSVPEIEILGAIVLLGVITFAYRYSFIGERGRTLAEKIPPELLMLLGPATFTAIIANNMLSHQGNPTQFKQKLIVAAFSIVVAYVTKNIIATLLFGLTLLYILQNYIPIV